MRTSVRKKPEQGMGGGEGDRAGGLEPIFSAYARVGFNRKVVIS